jgi:hypothetical protein
MMRLTRLALVTVLMPATAHAQHGAAPDVKPEKPSVVDHAAAPATVDQKKESAKPVTKESPKETATEGAKGPARETQAGKAAKEPAKGSPEAAVAEIMRRLQQDRSAQERSSSAPAVHRGAVNKSSAPSHPRIVVSWRLPVTWPAELLTPPER